MRAMTSAVRLAALACAAALVCAALPASADVYYVDAGGGGDFTAIKPAVQAASDGDTVYVTSGTYTGADNRDILITGRNLNLIGSSAIIDCEGQGRALHLSGSSVTHDTLIKGLTIINGVARTGGSDGGGAILCDSGASPTIEYCTIRDCDGKFGGGLKLLYSDAIVRYSWFRDNTADYGGAVSCSYGSPLLDMVHLWGNQSSVLGGAVRCYEGEPQMNRLEVVLNSDLSGNAAIRLDGSSPAITRCIIAFSTQGGAVSGGTTGVINHCVVYGNAGGDGLPSYAGDNLFDDPLFCDLYAYDPAVCEDSPALHDVNPWGEYIGYCDIGCYAPCQAPTSTASWGMLKALYR